MMRACILAFCGVVIAACSNPLGGRSAADGGYQPGGLSNGGTPAPTPFPAPTISGINPSISTFSGGSVARITGTDFRVGATANIGGVACTGLTVISSTAIDCTLPAASAIAAVDVSVENSDAQTATLTAAVTYIGEPKVWLNADSISSLTSGDAVTTWSDQSSNANHFTQASSGLQPTWIANALNGHAVARFNNGFMTSTSAIGISGAMPRSGFFVAKKASAGARNIFGWGAAGADQVFDFMNYVGVMMLHFYVHDTSSTSPAFTPNVWSILNFNYTGTAASTSIDNGTSAAASIALVTTDSQALIGGGGYPSYNGYDGDIAEAIVLPQAVSAAEQTVISCYLSRKYSLGLAGCP